MSPSSWFDADGDRGFQVLWEEGDRVFCRGRRRSADGDRDAVLAVLLAAEHPTPTSLDRLAHEYGLRDELEGAWAVRPLELVRARGRTMLVLEDPGGEPLERQLGGPMEVGRFLRLAIRIAAALGKLHRHCLVHKDIKPANILVNRANEEVRLTGFGIASRLLRERPAPDPPETIAGTLAYMAPEQTGRMNRSIDARSDLYALGVTLYQMLTSALPFTATDPMEWVHCHIARKPVPPGERLANVPAPVSAIIMKLLAKMAEDRYQTAGGVERDLRRCLAEWELRGDIVDFPLSEHDTPDRLLIPEKLYGRGREVETLLAAFDRIVRSGAPELVLVSGYSGIGKSSVVNELHKALVPPRGLFAAGKFDQYKRDIPYATLAQAFQSLVRPLLGKSDTELSGWRDSLLEALAPNGRLIIDVVPELKLIIGEQPPISELPPQDAQRRFQMVFRRLIGVFARPGHPLALFLDDLQWLDAATLDLLEDLVTRSDLQHLMLIGAYRDNEVTAAHPLRRKLDAIKAAGGKVAEITLAPLAREHLGQLIADALRCEPTRAAPLAQLVHEKTGGNPFFAIQFISSLGEEALLAFDHDAVRWSWDLGRIRAKGYTDNVVDLMVGRLTRLPAETQAAVQQFACLGNTAETALLALVLGASEADVDAALWEAVRQELVERLKGSYRFSHDRIQEAAYSLIPTGVRDATHLRIGRLLAAQTPPEQRREMIFEIVDQLNRSTALITEQEEREQLAELNLIAGKRAKDSTAYASALTYLTAGRELLTDDRWAEHYRLLFDLEIHRAECEYLTGQMAAAETRLATLAARATNLVDRAAVARQRLALYTILDRFDRAVEIGLEFVTYVGINWSPHPSSSEIDREYAQIRRQVGSHEIEQLVDLPPMTDPGWRATVDVLCYLTSPALFSDSGLGCLVLGRIINLSLEHGHTDGSCFAYVYSNLAFGCRFGDYRSGFRFAKLGFDLMEQRKLFRFRPLVYLGFAIANSWIEHLSASHALLRRAVDAAREAGDLVFACFALRTLVTNLIASGVPLAEIRSEAESALEFAREARFGLVFDIVTGQLALIQTLQGRTSTFGSFNHGEFNEIDFERHLEKDSRLAFAACWYWVRKLQARYYANDYLSATEAEAKAYRFFSESPSFRLYFEAAEFHFYAALARAAFCKSTQANLRSQHLDMLLAHHLQLKAWAEHGPDNLADRVALVGAEIAHLEGREVDAERLYERAIKSARDNGFVHNEALAYELAARFYAMRGFDEFAHVYLRNARDSYLRWGADGKVRQLEKLYPHLSKEERVPGPAGTIGAPVEHLDLATVLKVSQAVSSEIVLEKLVETLMRTAIAQAGAERGVLVLWRGAEPRIEAEATTRGGTVFVQLRDAPVTGMLPESVLHYVLRTRESVILDNAAAESPFAEDPYVRQLQARSILCLPLINQSKPMGVLYLENSLAYRVFAPGQAAVLKVLASQAAISLENTRLYRDLAEREAKIRRLVEANIIGIFIFDLEGRILEANDAFLRIVGYDREDLFAGRVRWTDLTPPEWLDRHARAAAELKMTGAVQPHERECFRKDGSRVPMLIGSATFDEQRDQGVAFVLDLTERKSAEAEARDSERRYRAIEMELAHANRLATMGQLTASIAHEVNHPIAATVTNAQAGLRWLSCPSPDLEEARQAFARIVKDGNRAGDVITRIRALIKKAPPRKDRLDINEAIREVIALTRGEAVKTGVSAQTDLMEGLPLIHGDRVQLQQVVLNLTINAVEAMSGGGEGGRELWISTGGDASGGVHVAVRDSGPGLDPTRADRLFEAFYTTKPDGMGMGLAICRSIIEAHGGRLWASANKPRGAVFQFTLPEGREETAPAEHAGQMPTRAH